MKPYYLTFTFIYIFLSINFYAASPYSKLNLKSQPEEVTYLQDKDQRSDIDENRKPSNKVKTVLIKLLLILVVLAFAGLPMIALGIALMSWVSPFLGMILIAIGSLLSLWLIGRILMNSEKKHERRQKRKARKLEKQLQ